MSFYDHGQFPNDSGLPRGRLTEQNVFAGVCWNKAFVNIRFTITDDELQIKLGQKEITSFIN